MSDLCSVNADWSSPRPNPCGSPDVTHELTVGCAHEHISKYLTCGPCRARLLPWTERMTEWICNRCLKADGSHICGVMATWRELTPVATS